MSDNQRTSESQKEPATIQGPAGAQGLEWPCQGSLKSIQNIPTVQLKREETDWTTEAGVLLPSAHGIDILWPVLAGKCKEGCAMF